MNSSDPKFRNTASSYMQSVMIGFSMMSLVRLSTRPSLSATSLSTLRNTSDELHFSLLASEKCIDHGRSDYRKSNRSYHENTGYDIKSGLVLNIIFEHSEIHITNPSPQASLLPCALLRRDRLRSSFRGSVHPGCCRPRDR